MPDPSNSLQWISLNRFLKQHITINTLSSLQIIIPNYHARYIRSKRRLHPLPIFFWLLNCIIRHSYISPHRKRSLFFQQILCKVMHFAWCWTPHRYGVPSTSRLPSREIQHDNYHSRLKSRCRTPKILKHLHTIASISVQHPGQPQIQSNPA